MEKRVAGFKIIDEPECGTYCVDCTEAEQDTGGQWVDGFGNDLRPVYYRRQETDIGIIYSRPNFECARCGA